MARTSLLEPVSRGHLSTDVPQSALHGRTCQWWWQHFGQHFREVTIHHGQVTSDIHLQHPHQNQITKAVVYLSSSHIHGTQPDHLFHAGVFRPFSVKFPACGDPGLLLTSTTWLSAFPWRSRSLTKANSVLRWFLSLCFPQSQQRQALSKDCSENTSALCVLTAPLEAPSFSIK